MYVNLFLSIYRYIVFHNIFLYCFFLSFPRYQSLPTSLYICILFLSFFPYIALLFLYSLSLSEKQFVVRLIKSKISLPSARFSFLLSFLLRQIYIISDMKKAYR